MTYSQAMTSARETKGGYRRNQNTTYFKSSRASIGPVSNVIILVVIVSLLGLIYLTQVTRTYALGYKVDDLTKHQSQLDEEHSRLELEAVKLQSIDRVKNSQATANLKQVAPSGYAQ